MKAWTIWKNGSRFFSGRDCFRRDFHYLLMSNPISLLFPTKHVVTIDIDPNSAMREFPEDLILKFFGGFFLKRDERRKIFQPIFLKNNLNLYEWLEENIKGRCKIHAWHDHTVFLDDFDSGWEKYRMEISFSNKNDAILFKLACG